MADAGARASPRLRHADQKVLEILGRRVRFLSRDQVGRVLDPEAVSHERVGRSWVRRMERAGLVESFTVLARPPSAPEVLASYVVGGAVPDFTELARTLRRRAESAPAITTEVVRIGRKGASLAGVDQAPRRPRRAEAGHDFQMAEVAIHLSLSGEVLAWASEEELIRESAYAGVVPDAEVNFSDGRRLVIECGGAYSRAKLDRFHSAISWQLERRRVTGYVFV